MCVCVEILCHSLNECDGKCALHCRVDSIELNQQRLKQIIFREYENRRRKKWHIGQLGLVQEK